MGEVKPGGQTPENQRIDPSKDFEGWKRSLADRDVADLENELDYKSDAEGNPRLGLSEQWDALKTEIDKKKEQQK